jgi:hypothetical protein
MTQPYAQPMQQPQYPAQPAYGQPPAQNVGYPPLAQQFAPAPSQYQMPAGYPQPQMAPPAPPLAQGSIDDFYNQPSTGGGKSLSFEVGTRHVGVIARAVGPGDIQQQTAQGTNQPQFFKDGRPKFVMIVPLQMQPSPEYPDGRAGWWVKGNVRDELVRAMAEAGAPEGPPQAGAVVDITCTGARPIPNMSPQKQYRVIYTPPGQQPTAAPAAPVQQEQPQAPAQQYAPPPQGPVQQPVQYQQPVAPLQAQPAAPAQQLQPPADMSPEQQALLARITGQQQS